MRAGGQSVSSSHASLMPSHTSVGRRSRTLRAFSRARSRHEAMLSGLSRPNVTNHGTLRSSARRWVSRKSSMSAATRTSGSHTRRPPAPLLVSPSSAADWLASSRRARFSARSRSRAVQ